MIFEERLEGGKGVYLANICGENNLGTGKFSDKAQSNGEGEK